MPVLTDPLGWFTLEVPPGWAMHTEDCVTTLHSGCHIYAYQRDSEGRHWRFWSVTDDETALLISYTCEGAEVGEEAAEVEDIVRSTRLYHSVPVH